MFLDASLVRRARSGAVVVELGMFLSNAVDFVVACLDREAPDWLLAELAIDGLQLYYERSKSRWILTSLDE